MAQTKTYDPGRVVVTFGPHIVTGYAEGAFVRATRDEDSFTKRVGADGRGTRVRNRNRGGSVEIVLHQSSPSNDFFAAKVVEDELLGVAVFPLVVKDLNGTTLVAAAEAWIKKPADVEEGKDLSDRTWILDTTALETFAGGNTV